MMKCTGEPELYTFNSPFGLSATMELFARVFAGR
jgi:hypothetical protein